MERQKLPVCAVPYLKGVSTPKLTEWFEFKKTDLYEAMIEEVRTRQRRLIEEVFTLPAGKIEPRVLTNRGKLNGLKFVEDFMNDVERELEFRNQRDAATRPDHGEGRPGL